MSTALHHGAPLAVPTIKSITEDLRTALSEADHLSGFNDYKALQVLASAVVEALDQLRKQPEC